MIPERLKDILSSDPETLGGTVCFKLTRIPVRVLFDHVNHGVPLDDFLEGFPSVHREDALRVLEWEKEALVEPLLEN